MEKRRIQLIAGSSYSVSLPKDWVLGNNLREKHEVIVYRKNDKTLVLAAKPIESMEMKEILLRMEDYDEDTIEQIVLAVYYLGVETITIVSEDEFTKQQKSQIRHTISRMAGTEINYEDKQKIVIKILIDKSKVELRQVLYRLNLLLDFLFDNLQSQQANKEEAQSTEDEVDRLYHLIQKILSIAQIDSTTLQTSGIKNLSLIPSYFRITKRLERISDELYKLCVNQKYTVDAKIKKEILDFCKESIGKSMGQITKKKEEKFIRTPRAKIAAMQAQIQETYGKSNPWQGSLELILRYSIDIEEEITTIIFYNWLIDEQRL